MIENNAIEEHKNEVQFQGGLWLVSKAYCGRI
jgi:hypothetical protein